MQQDIAVDDFGFILRYCCGEGNRSSNTESERNSERQPEKRCAEGESPQLSVSSLPRNANTSCHLSESDSPPILFRLQTTFLIFTPLPNFYSVFFIQPAPSCWFKSVKHESTKWRRFHHSSFQEQHCSRANFASQIGPSSTCSDQHNQPNHTQTRWLVCHATNHDGFTRMEDAAV